VTTVRNREQVEAFVMQMQDAYLETPDLSLTLPRARERFGLDEATCGAILAALADARVLTRTDEGAYVRRFPRPDGGSRADLATHAA
jgi:hypothetical protein